MNKYYAGVRMLSFPEFNNGGFVEVEGLRDIPFEIKRVFYIFGKGNVGSVRGKHSNRKSEFVLFNVKGRSKVKTIDEDRNEVVYELNEPNQAVYLPKMVWKEMYDFTEDSVMMVLTNEYYDSEEYIRDFEDFVTEMKRMTAEEAEYEKAGTPAEAEKEETETEGPGTPAETEKEETETEWPGTPAETEKEETETEGS